MHEYLAGQLGQARRDEMASEAARSRLAAESKGRNGRAPASPGRRGIRTQLGVLLGRPAVG